jgi:methionyl-tRNA formyltransferase
MEQLEPEQCRITHYPATVLGRPAQPVGSIDDNIRRLADGMIDIMLANKGIGLAGPQAGVGLRIFVVSLDGTKDSAKVYINPHLKTAGRLLTAEEGCLSLLGIHTTIRRHEKCSITATDLDGKQFTEQAEGLLARVFQHECDHLDGMLITDRIGHIAGLTVRSRLKELRQIYKQQAQERRPPNPVNIVYFGSGSFGLTCLDALLACEHRLCHIFTQPAQPAGRGRLPQPTPVALWTQDNSIPCTETTDVNSPQISPQIRACRPDVLVVIAFGQKIAPHLLALPAKAAVNVHASLLPRYRGAAPVNWALINGETETGVSIIDLAEKMDAGSILAQQAVPIDPDENAAQLSDRLAQIAAPLLLRTLNEIQNGTAVYLPQDSSKVTYAPRLKKSDGFLDWNQPAESLKNRVRGLWPWPGAQCDYLSKKTAKSCRVTIAEAQVVKTAAAPAAPPGELDENLNVICGQGTLRIAKIRPAGGALMDFADFVNGRRTAPGDLFARIE